MLVCGFVRKCLCALIPFFFCFAAQAEQTYLVLGTAGVSGVYYPAGGTICRLLNKNRNQHGIRCAVESTGGSIYNLNSIRNGQLDIAGVQSDWQFHAWNGGYSFEGLGPDKELRSLFSLHPEPFTVLARVDAGIKTFDDLWGKRVDIGNPGSGPRATLRVLMQQKGWTLSDFSLVSERKPSDQAQALCDNNIDAMIYTVGHPSSVVKDATSACDSVLVPVSRIDIERLLQRQSYYRSATIPGGMYRSNKKDVITFGVGATYVSSTRVPDKVVYHLVKSVFENLAELKALHPALQGLDAEKMVSEGLSAPLHPGARLYFEEAGLL